MFIGDSSAASFAITCGRSHFGSSLDHKRARDNMKWSSSKQDEFYENWCEENLPSMQGKVVCITGSTSGTGLVAAMECAKLGAHVAESGRRPSGAAS